MMENDNPEALEEKDRQAVKEFRRQLSVFLREEVEIKEAAEEDGDVTSSEKDGKKQQKKMVMSKESVKHLQEDLSERDCVRFIRARKYDVPKAVTMILKWSQWYYKAFDFAGKDPSGQPIRPCNCVKFPYPMEHVRKALCPHSYMGRDKEGRPLYWEQTGLISTRFAELSTFFSVNDLTLQHVRMQEQMRLRCEYYSKQSGKNIDKVVCIMDLKNLSYRLDTEALRAFRINLQIDTDYYPERLKYLYMINAPWFFTSIWAMMRPLIDPVTADKIKIVGKDYLGTLREHIDDDQIPPELGGSCSDFQWEYPWPASTGISEEQLGYTDKNVASEDPQTVDAIRSRETSAEESGPRHLCLAAVLSARITEVERLKSHDEFIITVQEVDREQQCSVQAKHRYSDFVALRAKLKRILKGEKSAMKLCPDKQLSLNHFLTLPPLPPKKLFSQSGSVLSSRILGLSSFLTSLLLSVKVASTSAYFPSSSRSLSSSSMEDPIVTTIMQFLMFPRQAPQGFPLEESSPEQEFEVEDEGESESTEGPSEVVESESEGVDLQSRLRQIAGGGIVSVCVFGLSIAGMYLQQ